MIVGTCPNCNRPSSDEDELCPHCGARLVETTRSSVAAKWAVVTGLAIGGAMTVLLYAAGAALNDVGFQTHEEFAPSQGSAWFWLAALVIDGAILGCTFAIPSWRRIASPARALLLTSSFVVLGGLGLCNAISVHYLVPRSSDGSPR